MKDEKSTEQENRSEGQDDVPKDLTNRKISQLSDLPLRYTYSNASSSSEFSTYEPISQTFQSKFVQDTELYLEISQKLDYVRSIVNIENEDICLFILQYYQWNQQKLSNQFFNDDWESLKNHEQVYINFESGQRFKKDCCEVCLVETQVYNNGFCSHFYCRICWAGYIKQQLQGGLIFFGCMNSPSCIKGPVLTDFVAHIAPELSQLNLKKICVSYSIQNKDICYCQNQKCRFFCVKPNMMEINTVACPCGQIYCFRCRLEPHYPVLCKEVHKWYKLINSEQTNSNWISNNTKVCPKCKQPIQKKVGCSHMKCICQCQFCFECCQLWDEKHSIAKTQCPYRQQLTIKQKKEDRVINLDLYLGQLMKQSERHKAMLEKCQTLIKDQTLIGRVVQLKSQVIGAWMTLKWTKIELCLQKKGQIQHQLQKAYLQSIRSVMEPIQTIIKGYKGLGSKDLHHYGQQVLQRKEVLKRNVKIWLEAWEFILY